MMKTLRNILFIVVLALSVNSCHAQFFWSHTKKSETAFTIKYGLLYNWYAVTDSRNIASEGWSVPVINQYQSLIDYLGESSIVGGKLKETGTSYWASPNNGATNEVYFNGRGAGLRFDSYGYLLINEAGYFWSSSYYDVDFAYGLQLGNTTTIAFIFSMDGDKRSGCSIRLIKNSTTLTHGQSGTYTGNDGKIYRTICIGTQEWLADNLCETKYRNGDLIPEVTDNTAWAALTTGALCAYDNDWSNAY